MLTDVMAADMAIHDQPLSYAERLEQRALHEIDLVVIHCTELPDLVIAREFGERIRYETSGTGNSGHFYIERSGEVYRYVPEGRLAHHTRGYNRRSIGIELVNNGRYPDWLDSRSQTMSEPYPPEQIESLIAILNALREHLPNLRYIAGHDHLDRSETPSTDDPSILVRRKIDPGPMFPWPEVLARSKLQLLPIDD